MPRTILFRILVDLVVLRGSHVAHSCCVGVAAEVYLPFSAAVFHQSEDEKDGSCAGRELGISRKVKSSPGQAIHSFSEEPTVGSEVR